MSKTLSSESFYSTSGDLVSFRRIQPADAPLLVDIFEHMSPESRFRRYNQTVDHLAPNRVWQEALRIAQADPLEGPGLVALVETPQGVQPVGAVRLVKTAPGEAEVAISIRDDFQNRGIGTTLMLHIADLARDLGYRRIVASIRNDNPAIWVVFNRLPYRVEKVLDGSLSDIVILLDEIRETAEPDQ